MYKLTGEEARGIVESAYSKLLANEVMEDFDIQFESSKEKFMYAPVAHTLVLNGQVQGDIETYAQEEVEEAIQTP